MIRYALSCEACDHGFDAWFQSSSAFDRQAKARLVECPACGAHTVTKAIMAPAIRASGEDRRAIEAFKSAAREHIAENFDYVGEGFAEEARAMYYGEEAHRPIWGETTPEERAALDAEGVPAAPLPPGFAPPRPKRPRKPRDTN